MSTKFRHAKSLGQNFLTDRSIVDEIIAGSLIGNDDFVIEIGPGMGVLTQELADIAAKVVAIEIDTRLIPILNKKFASYDNVEFINEDVMKCNINEIIADHITKNCKSVRIVGNLPYYITTPIVMKLLEEKVEAESITVMIQKEVADRIVAEPGSKACGAITASAAYYCETERITEAPASAFEPRPKVDSTVIRLDVRSAPPVELLEEESYFEVVKYGFAQRRKTLLNALTGMRGMDKAAVGAALESAGVDAKRRAETLSIDELAAVANAVVALQRTAR